MTEQIRSASCQYSGEDSIHQYLSEIHGIPMLSEEEERQLAMRCAQGDADAIRAMVKANLRLVVFVAKEYAGRGVPLLDLIQEGSIGLLTAARKFDYSLDYRFSTYATKWIRQGVMHCLTDSGGIIRIPRHTAEKLQKIENGRKVLTVQLGAEPSVEELSAYTGIPSSRIAELQRLQPNVCSLDVPTGQMDTDTMGELLEDRRAVMPHEALVRSELESMLHKMLASLNPRQQQILQLHFGLEDGQVHSLEEIGKVMGISKERVRQIEHQAMEQLQRMGTGMGLEDFLNE